MKAGVKTSEFLLAIFGIILGFLKAEVWPDLPSESFIVILGWIFVRTGLKAVDTVTKNKNGGVQ